MNQLLHDWIHIDTDGARSLTDIQLLHHISQMPITNGWGLVAELMKRYASLKGMTFHRVIKH